MDPTQFLSAVQGLPAGNSDLSAVNAIGGGDGMKRCISLNVLADFRTTGGLVLTGATVPTVAAIETNALGVVAAAGGTASGSFTFMIPKDYDPVKDLFYVSLAAGSAGTTDTPTFTANAYRARPQINYPGGNVQASAALTAALTVTAISAAVNKSTSFAKKVAVNLSGNGLQPDDIVTVNLVASAHATDALNIYGCEIIISSNFVFTDMAQRS